MWETLTGFISAPLPRELRVGGVYLAPTPIDMNQRSKDKKGSRAQPPPPWGPNPNEVFFGLWAVGALKRMLALGYSGFHFDPELGSSTVGDLMRLQIT